MTVERHLQVIREVIISSRYEHTINSCHNPSRGCSAVCAVVHAGLSLGYIRRHAELRPTYLLHPVVLPSAVTRMASYLAPAPGTGGLGRGRRAGRQC